MTQSDKPLRIIRPRDLKQKLGVSHATLWRWGRTEGFPAKVQLGPNAVGWIEEEIDDWILSQKVSRPRSPADNQSE